jgi:oligosaccharide repeat unit polymerase
MLNKPSPPFLMYTQVGVIAGILTAWILLNQEAVDAGRIVQLSCIFLLIHFVWVLYSWKKTGSELFSPYPLFAASVFVFNAGQAFLEVFGLNRGGLLGGQIPESILAQTLLLVLYATSIIHFGALFALRSKVRRKPDAMSYVSSVTLRQVAFILFIVALIPSLIVARRSISLVTIGGYGALYQAESGTGFSAAPAVLSGFLMPSGFLLLAGSGRNRWSRLFACTLIGSYVLLQLFIGFRGTAVVVLMVFLWLWHRTIRRLPKLVPILGLAIAVLILPVLGLTRSISGPERISLSVLKETFAGIDNPTVALLSEMGGSMLAPAYTILLVPSQHAYELGMSYVYAAFSLFPNLFWAVHPSVAHSPSQWLVNSAASATARAGGGLGYSVIAEAYLNFGFIGAGAPMLLLGWGVGRLSRWAEMSHTHWKLCLAAIALVPLLIYGRAEAGNVLRGIVWYTATSYFMIRFWPKRSIVGDNTYRRRT